MLLYHFSCVLTHYLRKRKLNILNFTRPIERLENDPLPLPSREKIKLAHAYFWLGYLKHTLAILDVKNREFIVSNGLPDPLEIRHLLTKKELEDWDKDSPNDRARVSLYLGYAYLALGNVSEAYKNFIDAFGFNPKLKYDTKALQYSYLEGRD